MTRENQVQGLYIHIPFCAKICSYCDFVKFTPDAWVAQYPALVEQELRMCLNAGLDLSLDTLYIGGGTPTIQRGECLEAVIHRISKHLSLSSLKEFTVEINPETLTPTLLKKLKTLGVTRTSVGLQSTFSSTLINLGRHYAKPDLDKLRLLKECSFSTNLDLIFAVPGMTPWILEETLNDFLSLEPQHISTYELTLYENHPSYAYLPNETQMINEYKLIENIFTQAGFERYEVSNFARPHQASKHNLLYWNFGCILGLGVSAHSSLNKHLHPKSTLQNQNWTNPKSLPAYKHMIEHQTHPYLTTRPLSSEETERELLIAQLRKTAGLDLNLYERAFHKCFKQQYKHSLPMLVKRGYLQVSESAVQPTSKGILVLDGILRHLFEDLDPNNKLPTTTI